MYFSYIKLLKKKNFIYNIQRMLHLFYWDLKIILYTNVYTYICLFICMNMFVVCIYVYRVRSRWDWLRARCYLKIRLVWFRGASLQELVCTWYQPCDRMTPFNPYEPLSTVPHFFSFSITLRCCASSCSAQSCREYIYVYTNPPYIFIHPFFSVFYFSFAFIIIFFFFCSSASSFAFIFIYTKKELNRRFTVY